MGAGLPGQCDGLRRAAAADDQSGPQGTRRHLHGEMPDAAPAARDIDRVSGLDGPVKTRESGQEAHRQRRRIAEAQGWRLADGEELACDGIAAFASAPARCHPAAITVQIGHGGHRVADGYATHTIAHGDHHASEVKPENDGGRPSHEIEVGQLILQRVERRGGDADQNLVGRRPRDGNTHRLERQPSSVSCVTDAEKRLRNRLSLLHVSLPSDDMPAHDGRGHSPYKRPS